MIYPLQAIRALALHATALDTPNGAEPPVNEVALLGLLDRLEAIQIDTLQMVARAHYVTAWSRLGTYPMDLFDRLTNASVDKHIFEGWYHAACFLPVHDYRYQMPQQRFSRENGHHWYSDWIAKPGNLEFMQNIHEQVRRDGPQKSSNLNGKREKFATWWNWHPEKMALEHLYDFGELMIARRENFARVYDLTARVLPAWADLSEPTSEERDLHWLERGALALGIGLPANPANYTHMRMGVARPLLARLIKSGVLLEVQAETMDGVKTLVLHRDSLPLLEKAAAGGLPARRTTFLNPFDNLWWGMGRDEVFWGFKQRLEAYYPAAKRIYGYYCLPILHHDRLVGRFDPKLEKKTGLLRIKALYLEPGIEPDELLLADVAVALRDFMQFHQVRELLVEKSAPADFGERLARALG